MLNRVLALAVLLLAGIVQAGELPLVEKRVYEHGDYVTVRGETIPAVRVGYETYGTLNAAGDNAIFVPHFYSGNSHAAGRYTAADVLPGYWDAIIGPGKAIDTDRYYVISADTLVNTSPDDPHVITTGPKSINPATGRHWGMSFPVVAQRDSVRVHRALLDSLGVKRLHAVVGASGGAIQAMEWAILYPDYVARQVHVIGPGFFQSPWTVAMLDVWDTPIRLDPKWNGGDYYDGEPPREGVAQSMKIISLTARHWHWAEKVGGTGAADPSQPPGASVNHDFRIVALMNNYGRSRGALVDANSQLYMSRANALYAPTDAEIAGIKARILFIPAATDLLLPAELSERSAERHRANGGVAEVFTVDDGGGHADGLLVITQAAGAIRAFLDRD